MRYVLALVCGLALLSSLGIRAQGQGPLLLRFPTISKTQIVFNYAGDLWIVGRDGGDARRLTTGTGVETYPSFSPDGSMIVAGGSDGVLRIWSRSSGRLLWMLRAHASYVVGVHYEGDDLVTRGFAGDIARWTLPSPDSVIEACRASACAGTDAGKWLEEPARVIIRR